MASNKSKAVSLDDLEDDLQPEHDPAGRSEAELDELEAQYLSSEEGSPKPREEEKEERSTSFAGLATEDDDAKPLWELTEDGATVMMDGDETEFNFKLLSNGEMLEAEVERRKLLGGALFPPVIGQDGSLIEDPMNNIALMVAIMKRAVVAPKNFVGLEMGGTDPDYLDRMVPVYRAYQEWRNRELEGARKKSKKTGSKFAS